MGLVQIFDDPNEIGYLYGARLPSADENKILAGLRASELSIQHIGSRNWTGPVTITVGAPNDGRPRMTYDETLGMWAASLDTTGAALNVFTSIGGLTWNQRTISNIGGINSMAASGLGTFVIGVTPSGSTNVKYKTSTDGITWTSRNSATTSTSGISEIIWFNSLFVSGSTAGAIETSPDGTTWTARTSGASSALVMSATDGSKVVFCGNTELVYSTNGTSWSSGTHPGTNLNGFCYSKDLGLWFAATDDSGGIIYKSTTGIGGWSAVTDPNWSSPGMNNEGFALAEIAGVVLVGWGEGLTPIKNYIAASYDGGDSWQRVLYFEDATNTSYPSLHEGPRQVFVGETERLWRSTAI